MLTATASTPEPCQRRSVHAPGQIEFVSERVHFLLDKAWKFDQHRQKSPASSHTEKLSEKQTIKMVSLLCQYARQIEAAFLFFSKNAKKSAKITLLMLLFLIL
jgi:hypothetical protein